MANSVSRMLTRVVGCNIARIAFVAICATTAIALLADASSAATRKLSGTYSRGQIEAACTAAGGAPYGTNPTNAGAGGGFGCATNGGLNQVNCDKDGHCTGTCPKCPAVVKRGLNGILRPPASAGTATAAAGTANKNRRPIHDVNQPVAVQHSGGTKH